MSGYALHAAWYDRIYAFKDYRAEADALIGVLAARGVAGGRLLDAGCGTGSHLAALRDRFEVAGFDAEAAMLGVAREKLPGVQLWQADVADFAVDAPFDVAICMFGAIGHVYPEERLHAAVRCLAAATRRGGVVAVEPFLDPSTVDRRGRASVQTWQDPDFAETVARLVVSRVDGDLCVLDTAWTVGRRGEPIQRFDERLELRLWTQDALRDAFGAAGLHAELVPFGRGGLWVAVAS